MLVLQRQIGNRATAQLVARAGTTKKTKKHPVVVEGETVIVTSVAEETEAKTIITTIRDTHGIAVDSLKAATATKDAYKNAPKKALDKIKALPWRMKDLRAVKRAVSIRRRSSARPARSRRDRRPPRRPRPSARSTRRSPRTPRRAGSTPRTLGEFYDTDRTFAIYKSSETNREDFANVEKQIEATTTHELAHGLMYYMINDFMTATGGYWRDEDTKANKKGAEKPPTAYGRKNAREGSVRVGDALLLRREAAAEEVPEAPRGDRHGGQGLDENTRRRRRRRTPKATPTPGRPRLRP